MIEALVSAGHTVEVSKPDNVASLAADLIVIGSPIYFEGPLDVVQDFVKEHAAELRDRTVAVFILGWARRAYGRLESHIRSNYLGPLVDPIDDGVVDRHMFRGWIWTVDSEQKQEAQEWILDCVHLMTESLEQTEESPAD